MGEQHWPLAALGDHVDLQTGFPFKSPQYTEDPSDIRLLRGDNIAQGFLRWDGVKRWPSSNAASYANFRLHADDVILAMDRPWIPAGLKYAWVKEGDLPSLLVQRVARLRGTKGLTTQYLRYIVGSPAFTQHVQSITTGVNVPHISGRDIKAFQFHLPPLDTQRRIAGILSAYDDLIENNERRIAILEEMARHVFREWFVDFRFPGHDAVRMVNTKAGRIPEGWELKPIEEVFRFNSGKAIKADDRAAPTGVRVFGANGVIGRTQLKPNTGPCVVIGKIGSCGSWHRCDEPAYVTNNAFAVTPQAGVSFEFMAWTLRLMDWKPYIGGSANPYMPVEAFRRHMLVCPAVSLQNHFEDTCRSVASLVANLHRHSETLASARDSLLPRLISSELPVSNAELLLKAAE